MRYKDVNMERIKENWMPLVIAALLGTSTGGGAATSLLSNHTHDGIVAKIEANSVTLLREIREVEYETEIYKLNVQLQELEELGETDTSRYETALAMVKKFSVMLTDLEATQ